MTFDEKEKFYRGKRLVLRDCACGCGKTFWVAAGNRMNFFSSEGCAYFSLISKNDFLRKKAASFFMTRQHFFRKKSRKKKARSYDRAKAKNN